MIKLDEEGSSSDPEFAVQSKVFDQKEQHEQEHKTFEQQPSLIIGLDALSRISLFCLHLLSLSLTHTRAHTHAHARTRSYTLTQAHMNALTHSSFSPLSYYLCF